MTLTIACGCAVVTPASAMALKISEFRLSGPNGADDEFVELYNETGSALTVNSTVIGATGYGVAASDGVLRCTIPNGTIIASGGHFLCANAGSPNPSTRYSLASYPSGNNGVSATTATPDASYTNGIDDNLGLALFNNNVGGAHYSQANRLDAVGSTAEPNATYKEGAGYTPLAVAAVNFSLNRVPGGSGLPRDTNDNASDLRVVATDGNASLSMATLGAPGPENMTSPRSRSSSFAVSLISPCVAATAVPNQFRSGSGNSGTLSIRRTITNNTGASVTRLRLRISDLSTSPAPDGSTAVLSAVSASNVTVSQPCGGGTPSALGMTLDTPPAQALGGGKNSSMSAGTVTLSTPLANGASIMVNLVLNVLQAGDFRVCGNVEALPLGATNALAVTGDTEGGSFAQACPPPLSTPANGALPSISGPASVAATLAGSDGTWTGTDLIFTRQWRRCDAGGGTCADIAGATGQSYTATAADAGSTLRFAVTASNDAGTLTAESAPSGVIAGPADTVAPILTSASLTNRVFAVARKRGAEVGVARAKRGTTFRYALSERARVVFTVARGAPGRRVGAKCRKQTRRNRSGRKCTRYVRVGRFAVPSQTGANRHFFAGKIGRKSLRRGRYRATLVATDAAGNGSLPKRLKFKVVRR